MANELALIAKQNNLSLLPDNDRYTNRIEIKSQSSNRLYVIAMNKSNGVWSCSCPGWIIHRNCKHLKAFSQVAKLIIEENKNQNKIE